MAAATAPAPVTALAQQSPSSVEPLHRPLDQILDLYVRDGFVYYRALQSERSRLDRYVSTLDVTPATYAGWAPEQQMAFWVNAYNAFVLQTVINHYPVKGKSAEYPAGSIRLIPGAFDKRTHRAAGRSLTLDEIEKTVLPAFKEPRLYLALGRGAVGSGRLRSEAFSGDRLERQLEAVAADFMTHEQMIKMDRANDIISLTPILSWREAEFVAKYDPGATGALAERSPIERALVAFITPRLLPLEKELVRKNTFRIVFHDVDWRLNDLTGGRIG
ncbi:MAG: DUF547 domain-containing protein [Vicinamibacterales bacterium]